MKTENEISNENNKDKCWSFEASRGKKPRFYINNQMENKNKKNKKPDSPTSRRFKIIKEKKRNPEILISVFMLITEYLV